MNLLATLLRLDARRPPVWLAAVGGMLVAWRLAEVPPSGTAVVVAWVAGAALAVAAIGAPLVAPAGTLAGADAWASLRALWPVTGMIVGTVSAIATVPTRLDAVLLLLVTLLTGAWGAVRIRTAAASLAVSEADGISLTLSLAGASAGAGWLLLPAESPAWGVLLAVACAWAGLCCALGSTEGGSQPGRPVSSPLVRPTTAIAATALVSPLRRLLVAVAMVVSLSGMVTWLFLVADAAPVAGWVALACFVAIAVPPTLVPDVVLYPSLGRLLATVPVVAPAGSAAGMFFSPRTTAAWWHAALLGWPPLVAALLHVREPSRALAALTVAAVPALAALVTSILGSPRAVAATAETRLAMVLVGAVVIAAAASGR